MRLRAVTNSQPDHPSLPSKIFKLLRRLYAPAMLVCGNKTVAQVIAYSDSKRKIVVLDIALAAPCR